ncbi:hypothetical protein ACFY36_31645 [Actinoplanes sp. NPDC000266]
MSPTAGPAFTIPGYTGPVPPGHAVVYAADGLVRRPAFWERYLSDPLNAYPEAGNAFEVTAEGRDAVSAVLDDPERWPVVSVRLGAEVWLRIVYRNCEDEPAIDFVRERPGGTAKVVASVQGHGFTSAMTWAELLSAAGRPDERLTWAQRLLLMLPMVGAQELPEDAEQTMDRALDGIGAANRAVLAPILTRRLDWRTP